MRRLRHWLGAGRWPAKASFDGERQRQTFDQAFWLARIYYASMLLIAYQEMAPLWKMTLNGGEFAPLWPIFWAADAGSAGPALLISLITSAVLAVALPDRRWPKILVFLSYFSASAFRSSFGLGYVNHGQHFWIWVGFCFCFLPSGAQADLRSSKRKRYRFLLTFFFTQALILLFYSMSGFWKIAAAIEALITDKMSAFHPEALAMIATWKMIQLDRITMLGPILADHPLLGWPAYLWAIYIEIVALMVLCRPALHRLWGIMLIGFHIGTFLLLGINFPKNVLVLTILFVWSPFAISSVGFREVLASLPGLGWLFRRSNVALKSAHKLPDAGRAVLVYDGDCPFCSRYATMQQLQDRYDLELINARDDRPIIDDIRSRGLHLDQGMVLKIDDHFYHGDQCLTLLALMATDAGFFSQVTKLMFGHPKIAALLYPVLAAGRHLTLLLLGRRKLGY
ncbi:MAG: hypothetical protein ACR2QF_18230 [Geminicoccaceae bacterium]